MSSIDTSTTIRQGDSSCRSDKWDAAISDAKQKIKRLTAAVEYYRDMKRKGEPWPGSENRAS
jgi:hypothetical protein